MKRFGKKLSALLVTAAMAATMASTAGAATTYQSIAGGTTQFKKYLIADLDAKIPAATFKFEAVAGEAIEKAEGKMAVLAGPDADKISIGDAVFDVGEELSNTVAEGDTVELEQGKEGYVKKTVTVNLSQVTFTEPGVYRYIISEEALNPDITGMNIDSNPRTLDVYVVDSNDGNNTLSVAGYVLHTDTEAPAANDTAGSVGGRLTTKSDGFTNTYGTHNLWVGKVVTGNQASRDKYFAITVSLSNLPAGSKYTVKYTGQNTDTTYGNADRSIDANPNAATTCIAADVTQPTELVATGGSISQVFYLQHGQHFVICGLPVGAEFAVSEDAEDYSSRKGADTLNFNDNLEGTIAAADVKTGFTNTRAGVIPTGVLLTMAPVIVVGVVVIAGLAFFAVRSAKRKAIEAAEADADSEE